MYLFTQSAVCVSGKQASLTRAVSSVKVPSCLLINSKALSCFQPLASFSPMLISFHFPCEDVVPRPGGRHSSRSMVSHSFPLPRSIGEHIIPQFCLNCDTNRKKIFLSWELKSSLY